MNPTCLNYLGRSDLTKDYPFALTTPRGVLTAYAMVRRVQANTGLRASREGVQ